MQDGDRITIAATRKVRLELGATEIETRRARWQAPPLKATRGVLAKYRRVVGSASEGAVTDRATHD